MPTEGVRFASGSFYVAPCQLRVDVDVDVDADADADALLRQVWSLFDDDEKKICNEEDQTEFQTWPMIFSKCFFLLWLKCAASARNGLTEWLQFLARLSGSGAESAYLQTYKSGRNSAEKLLVV